MSAPGMQDVVETIKQRRFVAQACAESFRNDKGYSDVAKAYKAEVALLDKLLAHYAARGYR